MSTVSHQVQLESAIRCHQSGDVATAAGIYARILQQDSEHADAWHLSGLVAFHQESFAEAELLIRRALELRPGNPSIFRILPPYCLRQIVHRKQNR